MGMHIDGILVVVRLSALGVRHRANDVSLANWTSASTGSKPGCSRDLLVCYRIFGSVGSRLHAFRVEFMATRQAHYPALAIDVFIKADDTFNLSASVFSPP